MALILCGVSCQRVSITETEYNEEKKLCNYGGKTFRLFDKSLSQQTSSIRNYSNISLPVSINLEYLPSTSSFVSLISAKDGIDSFSDCTFSPDNYADLSLQTHSIDSSDNRESYQFSLTQSEWLLICPSNRVTSLHSEWTNVFNTHCRLFSHIVS